jgi:hypothetical protein
MLQEHLGLARSLRVQIVRNNNLAKQTLVQIMNTSYNWTLDERRPTEILHPCGVLTTMSRHVRVATFGNMDALGKNVKNSMCASTEFILS